MTKNKVILFDIDYTLFDVQKYRSLVFEKLQQIFPHVENVQELAMKAYDEIRQFGSFDPQTFSKQLLSYIDPSLDSGILEKLWWDKTTIDASIYPEAEDTLKQLENDFTLGIFSSGPPKFQSIKIDAIKNYFLSHHVHIHPLKDSIIPDIARKYKDTEIFVVDDYIPVLEKLKKEDSHITTVWIKRGRLAEQVAPSKDFTPDETIHTLFELVPLVDKK